MVTQSELRSQSRSQRVVSTQVARKQEAEVKRFEKELKEQQEKALKELQRQQKEKAAAAQREFNKGPRALVKFEKLEGLRDVPSLQVKNLEKQYGKAKVFATGNYQKIPGLNKKLVKAMDLELATYNLTEKDVKDLPALKDLVGKNLTEASLEKKARERGVFITSTAAGISLEQTPKFKANIPTTKIKTKAKNLPIQDFIKEDIAKRKVIAENKTFKKEFETLSNIKSDIRKNVTALSNKVKNIKVSDINNILLTQTKPNETLLRETIKDNKDLILPPVKDFERYDLPAADFAGRDFAMDGQKISGAEFQRLVNLNIPGEIQPSQDVTTVPTKTINIFGKDIIVTDTSKLSKGEKIARKIPIISSLLLVKDIIKGGYGRDLPDAPTRSVTFGVGKKGITLDIPRVKEDKVGEIIFNPIGTPIAKRLEQSGRYTGTESDILGLAAGIAAETGLMNIASGIGGKPIQNIIVESEGTATQKFSREFIEKKLQRFSKAGDLDQRIIIANEDGSITEAFVDITGKSKTFAGTTKGDSLQKDILQGKVFVKDKVLMDINGKPISGVKLKEIGNINVPIETVPLGKEQSRFLTQTPGKAETIQFQSLADGTITFLGKGGKTKPLKFETIFSQLPEQKIVTPTTEKGVTFTLTEERVGDELITRGVSKTTTQVPDSIGTITVTKGDSAITTKPTISFTQDIEMTPKIKEKLGLVEEMNIDLKGNLAKIRAEWKKGIGKKAQLQLSLDFPNNPSLSKTEVEQARDQFASLLSNQNLLGQKIGREIAEEIPAKLTKGNILSSINIGVQKIGLIQGTKVSQQDKLKDLNKDLLKNLNKDKVMNQDVLKEQVKFLNIQLPKTKFLQDNMEIQKLQDLQKIKQQLKQEQKLKQQQKSISQSKLQMNLRTPTPKITPKITIKPIIKIPDATPSSEPRIKKVLTKIKAPKSFNVVIGSPGKEQLVARNLPKGKALQLLTSKLKTTLKARGRIIPTTKKARVKDIKFTPSQKEFREFKIVKGKQIKTPGTFIQRKGFRLGTRSEVIDIQISKRKGGKKRR